MKKITNEEAIRKCREVHGDKYDYSKMNYVSSSVKICIICPKHGEFWQYYHNHLKGCGCPACAGNKNMSSSEYIDYLKNKFQDSNIDFSNVKYVNNHTLISLICPTHGEWKTYPSSIIKKCECPECQKNRLRDKFSLTTEEFIKRAKAVHGDKYDYSKVEYVDSKTKVCIICPEHGETMQTPLSHLKGYGCPKCASNNMWNKRGRITTDEIIKRFKDVHGDKYSYDKVSYTDSRSKVCITCQKHGDFYQLPLSHLSGGGCPKCALENLSARFKSNTDEFIEKAKNVHGDKYIYDNVNYVNNKTKVCIICQKHGSFWQLPNSHLKGHGCPMCYGEITVSNSEIELRNFIKEISDKNDEVAFNVRNIISPLELDVVNKTKHIAIEYDGLYWHGEDKLKNHKYHLNKTTLCNKNGYSLIHIFEDEWLNKSEIVKSRLRSIFGVSPIKIGARKCLIREIDNTTSKDFLNKNHIQGNINTNIRYGLFYENELVSVMTFNKLRKNLGSKSEEGTYELTRFCNKLNTNVIGGASKLLSYFIKEYSPIKIISYADKRWSNGNMYEKLGFIHTHDSKPSYFYTLAGKTRENRFKFRKDILVKEGFDKNKSESQIMQERGYDRIYDCGCMVFSLNIKNVEKYCQK